MDHMGKIIDFHVHPYLMQDENLCQYKEHFQLTSVEAKADLQKAGIGKICGSVINREKTKAEQGFAPIKALNDKALAVKEVYGDFYEPGFHVHPGFVKESLETVEWMHQKGYRLIGEVVPYYHAWGEMGLDYGSKGLMEILDISGTGLFRYGMLREGVRQAGADKILFATDYPITNPWMYVEAVCFEHISDESKEKIFYKNAQRIMGWE